MAKRNTFSCHPNPELGNRVDEYCKQSGLPRNQAMNMALELLVSGPTQPQSSDPVIPLMEPSDIPLLEQVCLFRGQSLPEFYLEAVEEKLAHIVMEGK